MKKSFILILVLLIFALTFISCDSETNTDQNPEDNTEKCDHSEVEELPLVEATCTEDGLTSGVRCKICNEFIYEQFVIPAGHQEWVEIGVEPTCQSTGLSDKKYCVVCGEVTLEQTVLPIVDHKFEHGKCVFCSLYTEDYVSTGLTYTKKRFSYAVSDNGSCTDPYIVIPSTYLGLPVDEISENAFQACDFITEIKIPDSVKTIGSRAFNLCTSLTSIEIPDSVTSIGYSAFAVCTQLENITLPDSITKIGHLLLEQTKYYQNNDNWENGALYAGNHLIEVKNSVPSEFSVKNGTVTIADDAFYNCVSLEKVIIPDGLVTIGDHAFTSCISLNSVNIPNSVKTIGNFAFSTCGLTEIFIPKSVTSIGEGALNTDTLENIYVDSNNSNYQSIDGNLYNKDGTVILQYACGKSNSEFTLPSGVTQIGQLAFAWCQNLKRVNIPDGVTVIGDSAFDNCQSLESINIPDGITKIGHATFNNCQSLNTISIPVSVTEIGQCAFEYCIGLTDIYYAGSEEDWAKIKIDRTTDQHTYLTSATIHFDK